MDAASELTWMYLQRVMENDAPFMSPDYPVLAVVGAVYVSR